MDILIKTKISVKYILRLYKEFISDLLKYYFTPYPFLLLIGTLRRIRRRLKYLWLPKGRGRPPVCEEFIDLILDMKRSNMIWGAERISEELALMGIRVHKRTIQRILKENGFIPIRTKITPPTWSAFIKSHKELWAMDFTCVMDLKCFQIFILIIIDHSTRDLIHFNITLNPNRNWIIQQFKNCSIAGINLPSAIIIDNDGTYGKWIDYVFKEYFDITTCRIPRGSPWLNGRCERFHKSLKNELLYRVEIYDAEHAMRLCSLYKDYYNKSRPHQAIQGKTPEKTHTIPTPVIDIANFKYKKIHMIDGLITRFEIAA